MVQEIWRGARTTMIRQGHIGLKNLKSEVLFQTIEANLSRSTWRVSGGLGISNSSEVRHFHILWQKQQRCPIVHHITKILQNFWLTKILQNFWLTKLSKIINNGRFFFLFSFLIDCMKLRNSKMNTWICAFLFVYLFFMVFFS